MGRGKTRLLKKKITSITATSHITRAMEMVARARFNKIQKYAFAFRPYAEKYEEMAKNVLSDISGIEDVLLNPTEGKKVGIFLITGDMGLCGSYNTNVVQLVENQISKLGHNFAGLVVVGTKGASYFKYHNVKIMKSYVREYNYPNINIAHAIAEALIDVIKEGTFDRVLAVYTNFKSMLANLPKVEQFIPVPLGERKEMRVWEYEFEPSSAELIKNFLPRYLAVKMCSMLYEAKMSEFAARQTAMRNATDNAMKMIKDLTLRYNKERQAYITQEIIEITTSSEAINK